MKKQRMSGLASHPYVKEKVIRIICDLFIAIFLLGFVLALLWFIGGSFETAPTMEQQEKARLGAGLLMILTGIPCSVFVCVRQKYK